MLELAILGFLAEGPLRGYELRRRVAQLSGYTRPVSEGSRYPAISRLTGAGLLERRTEPGAGAARYVLTLTEAGRAEMLKRLRKPADHEITDFTRFFTVLAFLEEPASFFYDGDRPLHTEEVPDPYRRGMLLTARATGRAERAWLREVLGEDAPEAGAARTENTPPTLEEPAS
ncbi:MULTISPECIES: PadR family transcriptional regulator [Streptomyces]|uniref:PadR family transcriptional regulator n=1 Tax=Streptomyces TaxID=1883 RepID=UPI002E2DAEC2|nr:MULTISPECIES: PadR family transcriptional regulator [Streptomyces]